MLFAFLSYRLIADQQCGTETSFSILSGFFLPLARYQDSVVRKDSFQWTSLLEGEFHCLNRFIEIFFSFLRVQTDIAFDVYTGFAWPQTVRNKEDKKFIIQSPGLGGPNRDNFSYREISITGWRLLGKSCRMEIRRRLGFYRWGKAK